MLDCNRIRSKVTGYGVSARNGKNWTLQTSVFKRTPNTFRRLHRFFHLNSRHSWLDWRRKKFQFFFLNKSEDSSTTARCWESSPRSFCGSRRRRRSSPSTFWSRCRRPASSQTSKSRPPWKSTPWKSSSTEVISFPERSSLKTRYQFSDVVKHTGSNPKVLFYFNYCVYKFSIITAKKF